MDNEAKRIAEGLGPEERSLLVEGVACRADTTAMVEAGLLKPEFGPEYKQEYFLHTDLGKRVRTYLERKQ